MLNRTQFQLALGCLTLLALAACSGSATPQLIGAYPREAIATYAPPPGGLVVTTDAYVSLRVSSVQAAADKAEALTYDHGGYVSASTRWYAGNKLRHTLTLAVPPATYSSLHDALLRLGTLESEQVHSTLSDLRDSYTSSRFSTITVHLAPVERAWRPPALPTFGWNPLTTFSTAFGVFAGIATFVIDLAIWLTVVVGPFILLGLGLRALIRRWRPRP